MKTKTKLTAVLMLALAGPFASIAQQQSLTGVVTDSMCGTAHMAKDKPPAECTQTCVKDGMKYALGAEKKVHTWKDTKRNSPISLARGSRSREL
jgi:hypothetical protein